MELTRADIADPQHLLCSHLQPITTLFWSLGKVQTMFRLLRSQAIISVSVQPRFGVSAADTADHRTVSTYSARGMSPVNSELRSDGTI